jgi:hypothetical protein
MHQLPATTLPPPTNHYAAAGAAAGGGGGGGMVMMMATSAHDLSSGDPNGPRKRTKVSRACDECRRKKVKF